MQGTGFSKHKEEEQNRREVLTIAQEPMIKTAIGDQAKLLVRPRDGLFTALQKPGHWE
jgi:hypothetical protein